jgi:hypothetical protein
MAIMTDTEAGALFNVLRTDMCSRGKKKVENTIKRMSLISGKYLNGVHFIKDLLLLTDDAVQFCVRTVLQNSFTAFKQHA